MPLGRGPHVFAPLVNHFHGPAAGLPGKQGGMTCYEIRIIFLASETASGFRLDDAHAVIRQVEQRRHGLLNVVWALHRSPYRDALSWYGAGHEGLRLDVQMLLRPRTVRFLHNDVGVTP